LRDALFSGPGSADLLLPRRGLSGLLAEPAMAWLGSHGARLRMSRRVEALAASDDGAWLVDGERFDAVVLACSSVEAARLTQDLAPGWSELARALRFEPIVTVYLESPGSSLPAPMLALRDGPAAPAQFAFDLGQLDPRRRGQFSLVVSGAAKWTARGLDACAAACVQQAQGQLSWATTPRLLRVLAEKRATFACTPGLVRPGIAIAPGLYAAGDYVDGPYPATLEGAVRSGMAAARQALPCNASL
jgi:predicted NAD/FAD-dependent oxidoreductase